MSVVASQTILSGEQMMKNSPRFSKLRVENLEERTLLAVMAGGLETAVQTVAPTESATWLVNTLEDSWNEDPNDDIVSLREAIDLSADGDRIVFDASLASGTIVLLDGLEISKGITVDASGVGGITIDGNQKWTCFAISADQTETPVELIGLTITNGKFGHGGGIDFFGGSLNLTNCTITKNYANGNGGGIYQTGTGTTLTLTDCIISDNNAQYGGGIYQTGTGATLTLANCTISDNSAQFGGGIYKDAECTLTITSSTISENTGVVVGGIYCYDGTLTLTNSSVSRNTANNRGGGIYNEVGTLTITDTIVSGNDDGGIYNELGTVTLTDCTITENNSYDRYGGGIYNQGTLIITKCTISANNTYSDGGGIYNEGTLTLTDCTVSGNSTPYGSGGGIRSDGDTLTLTDSVVVGNSAYFSGGGIFIGEGIVMITNSTVSMNTAKGVFDSFGSGIAIENGRMTLLNCTVTDNAAYYGGGIYNIFGIVNLYNSIIAQNTSVIPKNDIDIHSPNYGAINAYNTLSSYNDWSRSENCIVYDPSIPLFTDALHGDFTPAENSQAVNTGNNDYVKTETDLAGNPRIYDGTVDIGAYEYQDTPSPVPTEQLTIPTIITGSRGIYVSYGANRHQITWTAVDNASGYELAYTTDGFSWSSAWVDGTGGAVGDLIYGSDVTYRVRALGEGPNIDSDWSETKTFRVCPMDINNDGDISGPDRTLLSSVWLTSIWDGDEGYRFYADIDGNGDISNSDRVYLSKNWLADIDAYYLDYPTPIAAAIANTVFTEYASADLAVDLDLF